MNSIIVAPKSKKDLELLKSMLKKMNFDFRELNQEEKEDAALLNLMAETANDETVPIERVLNFLDK
jgi:hypothetical protein